jgi:hypothetical protein
MSITSDIRSYADTALGQGKQVTEQANEFVVKLRGTAKDNVSDLTSKASDAVNDVRTQVEKAVNLEAIKSAIEPYLAQAKGYSTTVTDRAEDLYASVKSDKRVAAIVTKAEELTGAVVETVQVRVVKPVQSLTGLGSKPAVKKPVSKPAATKPATTKPAAKASKPATRKAPVKKATAKA